MRRQTRFLCCMAWASLCGSALARQAVAPCPPATVPPAPGMQAAIDPATGRLRAPTAAERQALAAAAASAPSPASSSRPRTDAEARRTLRHGPRATSMQLPESKFKNGGPAPPTDGCRQSESVD